MCTATVQGKEVFVNARLNQVLSLEDMVQLDVTTQKKIATALFYELASTGHPNHPKIDPVVWQVCALPLTSDELWTMQEPDDIKALLLQLYAVKESHFARMIAETKTLHRLQGMKILEAQQQLNFTAELTLSINQIRGYIEKAGQWNDFEPEVVGKILADMHESIPRPYNHDVNNPNWGQLHHEWRIKGDTILCVVSYCSKAQSEFLTAWGGQMVEQFKKMLQCDSMTVTCDQCDPRFSGYCFVLGMWWD